MTSGSIAAGGVYLRSYLAPLAAMLARQEVTDLYVNRPHEVWVETQGGAIERHDAPALDAVTIERLARQVAASTSQGISRERPLMSATLPDGSRMQVVAPPATRGPFVLAIRRHVSADLRLDDYVATGGFADTVVGATPVAGVREQIAEMLSRGEVAAALGEAVRARFNILISGGTSTGKTTFLNALLREVPGHERLIVIEDTPEVFLRHENAVGLQAVRGALGEAQVDAVDLVAASLRLRPDRIILGELRGSEALAFLRAVDSGHPGSMTTIHADSPDGAVEQLAMLVQQAGLRLEGDDIRRFVRRTIGLYVQLARVGGRRHVANVVLSADSGVPAGSRDA